jgi:hypothetical protein
MEINSYIHSDNQNRQKNHVTYVSTVFRLWLGVAADAAWMLADKNYELRKGSGHLYTVSFSVNVVADTLYHLTVAVETDTGRVQ